MVSVVFVQTLLFCVCLVLSKSQAMCQVQTKLPQIMTNIWLSEQWTHEKYILSRLRSDCVFSLFIEHSHSVICSALIIWKMIWIWRKLSTTVQIILLILGYNSIVNEQKIMHQCTLPIIWYSHSALLLINHEILKHRV